MQIFNNPDVIITDVMTKHAKWRADKPAIVMDNQFLSWSEFNQRVNKVANKLIALGLHKGDKVSVLMTNRIEVPEILFGTIKAGGVVVPLSTMLKGDALAKMVVDSDSIFLFVDSETRGLIKNYHAELNHISSQCSFSIDEDIDGWNSYTRLLSESSDKDPAIKLSYEDIFNIIYTSGTTGTPNGIVHSHHSRFNFAIMWALISRIDSSAVSIITTSLYTNGTWLILLPTFISGGTVVIMRQFDAKNFMALVEAKKGTHAFMVPTQFKILLEHPDFGKYDLSSMRSWLSAGSALWKKTKKELMQKLSGDVIEAYGCTEGVTTVLRPEEMGDKIGSVGLPPVGWDVRIIDDKGHELPKGQIGEIVGHTSFIMSEYYKLPEKTRETIWLDEVGRTYVKTGDIGRLDEDGYLYILDRKKDMIVSGGYNIFASDIEEVLIQHPDVDDIAVIAVPHEKWGETPLALVKLVRGAGTKADQLKEWVNERVAKYQRVSAVEFQENPFPRNALGKLLKRELRKPYWNDRS